MTEWEHTDAKYGISIQRGTPQVPDDDRYHVIVDGAIVLSTRVEAAAIAEFDELREQRRAPSRELLRQEVGDAAFRSMRSAGWAEKSQRDSQRGGRGIGRR
ncbi:hypothetical protein BOH72_17430 [Mycobacterium sp. WY10]|nr:hypothetical protein BOH72_17430 [Mycobacterium sp. WY10]